jgi:type IV fimbrial biogenesis protein FimT
VLIGVKYLSKVHINKVAWQSGFSLLELMAVVLIVAAMAVATMPLLQGQIAAREIESVARRFVTHAHFARQQALHTGEAASITPHADGPWEGGWLVKSGCVARQAKSHCLEKIWFTQGAIHPVYFKGGGRQFMDPHSGKTGILFNVAGAAKTGQGGFVANRLILGHLRDGSLERQMILGSGGRWRICDPARDTKRCH